jgi:hypothetical protein
MDISEAIKIALLLLWANKLRSAPILLGVAIGVAAMIAVVTFGNGIHGYVETNILGRGRTDLWNLSRVESGQPRSHLAAALRVTCYQCRP